MGQRDIWYKFYDSHFQPCIYFKKFISRSEISFSCLEEDIFLLELFTPCLLEGVNNVIHATLPLERDTNDVLQANSKLLENKVIYLCKV
jgi:hypothetical protein